MPSYGWYDEPAIATGPPGAVVPDDDPPGRSQRPARRLALRLIALALALAAVGGWAVACADRPGAGSRAVAIAASKSGAPYAEGASGPDAFDCSGFTQYVYRRLGVTLPRTATAQADAVTMVPQSAAAPGDLIFFGMPGNFYHVGIYAGDGQIWSAQNSEGAVKEGPIWDSGYHVGRVPRP